MYISLCMSRHLTTSSKSYPSFQSVSASVGWRLDSWETWSVLDCDKCHFQGCCHGGQPLGEAPQVIWFLPLLRLLTANRFCQSIFHFLCVLQRFISCGLTLSAGLAESVCCFPPNGPLRCLSWSWWDSFHSFTTICNNEKANIQGKHQ